ncbi:hypothetical protein ACTFIR_006441 [Dictyostelium discoideum]
MKYILFLVLLVLSFTEKCLPPITSIAGYTDLNVIVPVTFNSTHYSMVLSSYITRRKSSFSVMVDLNGFQSSDEHVFTSVPPNFESVKSISNDLTQFEIIGNGLKNNNFYNFFKDIRCDKDMSFDPSKERFVCYSSTSNSCFSFGYSNKFFNLTNQYFFSAVPTINSIERIGSFLLIDADFHCPNYVDSISKGISIGARELYGSLKPANRNSKTQYTFDPVSYDFSICLENDNYNISLISYIDSQTNYSSSVIFNCEKGYSNELSNAALTNISIISLFSFIFILLVL